MIATSQPPQAVHRECRPRSASQRLPRQAARPADEDPLVRAQRGDTSALGEFLASVEHILLAACYAILKDRELAADACQNACILLQQHLDRYRPMGKPKAWAWRIAHRVALQTAVARARYQAVVHAAAQVSHANAADPEQELCRRERWARLVAAVNSLPALHRDVVVLSFFEDRSLDEIARLLDIRYGTAASRLHYALKRLRERLEADCDCDGC